MKIQQPYYEILHKHKPPALGFYGAFLEGLRQAAQSVRCRLSRRVADFGHLLHLGRGVRKLAY